MGNTHDSEIARIEADHIQSRWKTSEDYRWGYTGDRGPECWWVHYPSAAGGMQSPVDIITEETWQADSENSNIVPLEIDYNSARSLGASRYAGFISSGNDDSFSEAGSDLPLKEFKILVNNGNTSRINIVNSRSYVSGGPFRHYSFVLEQIHIHWGENDNSGSEHHVNGVAHSAEVHFVHWNEDLYTSYEEAARNEDGVLAFAVFVQVSETKCNDALLLWSQLLEDTIYREENIPLPKEFPFKHLLPGDLTKYWTYHGSFSTPPCYETVTWIVFENCIYASSKVLSRFRSLKYYSESETRPGDEFDGQLLTNRRPVQPIGTRKICHVDLAHFSQGHDGDRGAATDPGRPFRGAWGDEKAAGHLRSFQANLGESRVGLRGRG